MKRPAASDHVPRETSEALRRFESLLLKWNKSLNLIAPGDEPILGKRHIADSLQLVPLMQPFPERAIDLGSGAGFPGLMLAIATGVPFELIEADQRKAAFLQEAIRQTGAPARVHAVRIETARIIPAPLITARALAPLPKLLALATPLLSPGGVCLFLKGANVEAELTHAAAEWHMQTERIPSRTSPEACILRISNLSRVTSPA